MAAKRTIPRKLKRRMLTLQEVARLLTVSPSLVNAWCKSEPPAIAFHRFGRPHHRGVYRFTPEAVTRVAEERNQGGDFDAHAFAEAIRAELVD